MDKKSFMLEKLYKDILAEIQALYAEISINKMSYDYDEYTKGINKLIAVGVALGLKTEGYDFRQ